jgi:hypothetical protein
VAPYAHTQHIKVPQHFVYIQYGCGIQSEASCSLYHYITTLHGLTGLPPKPKIHPRPAEAYHSKGGPIRPSTAYQGRAKTLCTYDRCGMHSEACCSLNNDITTSHGLRSTPKTPKSTCDLQRGIMVRVVPYAHTQHIKVPRHFVYIQYGFGIQSEACCSLNNYITTSHGLRSTPIIPKSTPDLQRGITIRVAPYAHTQHTKVPKPFCIHPIWMWDPV